MADARAQRPPKKTERKIGSTIYIVTSCYQGQGSTVADKVLCLLDVNTKEKKLCRNT